MRLLELSLERFGAIGARTLDFATPAPVMHVLYGPNEAGKSTTLRAVTALLYGVEERSDDARLFGSGPLRIRARLCDASGRELAVVRRKARKNALHTPEGTPLDESALAELLHGISQSAFTSMFGLDHEALRVGGEQLRLGRGDLGESLFQASLGGTSLRTTLDSLREEVDALWKPRAKSTKLRQAIDAYAAARTRLRAAEKGADAVRVQERGLEQQRTRERELLARLHAMRAEHSRLQRALSVAPSLAQLRVVLQQRAQLGEVVLLELDASERRKHAERELGACSELAARSTVRRAALVERRAALQSPEAFLSVSPQRIRELRDALGSYRKAARDLPLRRTELATHAADAQRSLRALGAEVSLENVETLRVDEATGKRVQELADAHAQLIERVQTTEDALRAATAQRATAYGLLDGFAPAADAARSQGARILAPETVAAFQERFEKLATARATRERHADEAHERMERARTQLDALTREGVPPTEGELSQARESRGAAWHALRVHVGAESIDRDALRSAADAYEPTQARADEVADRLRREASRVSAAAALHAEQDAAARALEHARQERTRLDGDAAALEAEWRAAWLPLGLVPRSPREMQPVVAKALAQLEAAEGERAQAERRQRELEQSQQRWRGEWASCMQRLALTTDTSTHAAREVLAERRRLFERVDVMQQLRGRIEGMERDGAAFEHEVAELVQACVPDLADVAVERAAEELVRRYEGASRDGEERARIEVDLRELERELAEVEVRRTYAERTLSELLAAARTRELSVLVEAEQRSHHARDLDRRRAQIEEALLGAGEGRSVETLEAELAGQSTDELRARVAELDDEIKELTEEHTDAAKDAARLEMGLARMQGDHEAADCAEELEQHAGAIAEHVREYQRKRLAAELLARVVQRYRDANQGPMVKHASELFARLTLGRYRGLDVDFGEDDAPTLQCVETAGRKVAVEALSDGTRDQLYLALRLASITRFAERAEPLPLVLDDVLIHFDEERARAALAVLSELSAVTQILFFTHQARLVELAREAIAPERLRVHELSSAGLGAEPLAALPSAAPGDA